MAIPVPNVIGSPFEYPAGTTPPASLAISCTPLAGTSYQWRLIERPPGSTAALTNATSSSVSLNNFSTPGTYILFLVLTNSFGSSHPEPYPIQSSLPPYGFATPLQTAFAVVRVADAAGLYKPGRGEYGWFEKGLWPLFDKVAAGIEFSYYDEPTRTLTANAIVPDLTVAPNDSIVSVAGLNVRNDTTSSEHELYNVYDKINVLSNLVVTSKDVSLVGGTLKTDTITDVSGGNLRIEANADLNLEAQSDLNLDAQSDLSLTASNNIEIAAGAMLDMSAPACTLETADQLLLRSGDGSIVLEADSASGSVSLTAGVAATVTAADITLESSDDTIIRTTGADADIALSTVGAASGISLTTVGANAPISLTSGKNLVAQAADEFSAQAVNRIYLASQEIVLESNTQPLLIDADGMIVDSGAAIELYAATDITLTPGTATTSAKPVRAPGLAICDTTFYKSDTVFPAGALFPAVPAYTRYAPGSDLDTNITVAAFAPKLATVSLLLKRNVGGTVSTLATITTPPLSEAGWCLFSIKCRIKITKDGHTVTHLEYDFTTPVAGFDIPTAPGSTTKLYTISNESFAGNAVSLQVETVNTLGQYSAQMTCALYNPHDQDVL